MGRHGVRTDSAHALSAGERFDGCRDERGVVITIIADNYYGYSKKEIKTQISYSANLFGLVEEEHAGGAIAFPRGNMSDSVFGTDFTKKFNKPYSFDEAKKLGIKTLAMVDTNSNPNKVNFPIPANDDASKSISIIVDYMVEAIKEGLEERNQMKQERTTNAEA